MITIIGNFLIPIEQNNKIKSYNSRIQKVVSGVILVQNLQWIKLHSRQILL
jgi:hypothetical protein